MNIILLEKVSNLGTMGDVVSVKDGYARNFLLPQKKALRATKNNMSYFEAQKATLEKQNEVLKNEASKKAKTIEGKTVVIVRAASEAGRLFGSVTTKDIAQSASTLGEKVRRSHIQLNQNFKTLGLFPVEIQFHPEVVVTITINIARSEDEAAIQQKEGRALIADNNAQDEDDHFITSKIDEEVSKEAMTSESKEETQEATE